MKKIYGDIKRKILNKADDILSDEVKEELGIKKIELNDKIKENCKDSQIGFFQPIDSQLLNSKEAQKVKSGSIIVITILIAFLLFLFFKLIVPNDNYLNEREGITVVDGDTVHREIHQDIKKSKVNEIQQMPLSESDLKVEDIKVASPKTAQKAASKTVSDNDPIAKIESERAKELEAAKKIEAQNLLNSTNSQTATNSYTVRRGDSLAIIAQRVYGSSSIANIEKIKKANRIRNPRSIQVGQKLVTP
ncbi:MAG: LysM peptidoglycan-binding domain-containing protein [Candidatus Melainabacteria bacterium]|nr:LysM peptidoglycan-binding domain-containing protein [Candidatus Melainabacteria bacterium]